jgi:polar amino acid transport system substrate-binding protein
MTLPFQDVRSPFNQDVLDAFAPTGHLRVAIAVGKVRCALWTSRDDAAGEPRGVTIDLARILAERLGLPLKLVEFASSGKIIEAAPLNVWDVSFAPVDEERKRIVDFGPNYFMGESTYLVPSGSVIETIGDVDREGVRVAGVENTATIRSARRTLTRSKVVGAAGMDDVLALFRNGEADAVALGRETLESLVSQFPGARVLQGHFHATGFAVAVPKGNTATRDVISSLLEELKGDGTIRRVFDAHGMTGASIPPVGSYS